MQFAVAESSHRLKHYVFQTYKSSQEYSSNITVVKQFQCQNVKVSIYVYIEIPDKNGIFPIVYAYLIEYKSKYKRWQVSPPHTH